MADPKQSDATHQSKVEARRFQDDLRRALATPPITNEEIERRSKEAKRKPA